MNDTPHSSTGRKPASRQAEAGRVLVADDDREFREALRLFLAGCGYEVEGAADARQAKQAIQNQCFDVLIADLNMPGNEGLEMVRDLSGAAGNLHVILLTGEPSLATAVSCVGLPVRAYLIKPPDLNELKNLVQTLAADQRMREGLRKRCRRMLACLPPASGRTIAPDPSQNAHTALTSELDMIASAFQQLLDRREGDGRASTSALARNQELTLAIADAVDVLEETKRSFKSKQLARLRAKLEAVLYAATGSSDRTD